MRILIDGSELSGKQGLIQDLHRVLSEQGADVRVSSYCLSSTRLGYAVDWCHAKLRPGNRLTLWLSVFAVAVDALLSRRHATRDRLVLHKGYIGHALGIAKAYRRPGVVWALSKLSLVAPNFDLQLCLSASHLEKVRRYLRREENTLLERLVLTEPDRTLSLDQAQLHWYEASGATVLDTDGRTANDLTKRALTLIEARVKARPLTGTVFVSHAA